MRASFHHSLTICFGGMLLAAAAPAQAIQARLVRCGEATCLRLSGHRPSLSHRVAIGGQTLAVAGGRDWRMIVSLAVARGWAAPSFDALTLSLTGIDGERSEIVALPPGALGRRVELAELVIRAH